jgi:hypothetical protein
MVAARGDRDVANAVFTGQELVKSKQVRLPPAAEYLEIANEYLGEVGEVYQAKDRGTIIKSALYHYATKDDGVFDGDDFRASLESMTGGVGEINGRRVELPSEVLEDDLQDFMDDLHPQTIEELGGLFLPIPLDDVRDGQLVSVGTNKYQIEIPSPIKDDPPLRQLNSYGEPLEFEITPELIFRNQSRKPIGRAGRRR